MAFYSAMIASHGTDNNHPPMIALNKVIPPMHVMNKADIVPCLRSNHGMNDRPAAGYPE